jgi:DNA-binding MarR family transcriptional regulator
MRREELIQEIIENLSKCQRQGTYSSWQKSGLSRAQIGMLFMISHHKRLQVKQVADFLGISKSAASQLLEPLSQKGLIERRTDPKDRRIARFRLSKTGTSELKKIHKSKYSGMRSRMENLDKEDLNRLVKISRKLIAQPKP